MGVNIGYGSENQTWEFFNSDTGNHLRIVQDTVGLRDMENVLKKTPLSSIEIVRMYNNLSENKKAEYYQKN